MRCPLVRYAEAIEEKLKSHDADKGERGWDKNKNDRFLQKKLLEEVAEYFVAHNDPALTGLNLIVEFIYAVGRATDEKIDKEKKTTKQAQRDELADTGAIAMMIFDNTT